MSSFRVFNSFEKTGVLVIMYNSINALSTSVSRVIISHEDMPVILTNLITIK